MKVGDLVRWNKAMCVVAEVYESKCWRSPSDWKTASRADKRVDWNKVENEPFARIFLKGSLVGVPQIDLEVIDNVE